MGADTPPVANMRVLMLNKYAHVTGGADRYCLSLIRGLREAGLEVTLLSTASPNNVERSGRFVPLTVTRESRNHLGVTERATILGAALWNRTAAAEMKALVHEFDPDVVHAHKLYPQLSAAPLVVAHRLGVPIVQTLHDYEFIAASPFDASGARIDRREQRRSFRALNTTTFVVRRRVHIPLVDEWIAVSEFVARVHARRGIPSTVIPNFADVDVTSDIAPLEERDGILFLGALSVEKGVLDVLRMARAIRDTSITIAGEGPLREHVEQEASRLSHVRYTGRFDPAQASDALRRARVVVVPSRWEEPGSLVALEAMATGTPLVAYMRGGLGEYVMQAQAGITAPRDDVEAFSRGCRSLLDDHALWDRCSSAGVEATRTLFSRRAHVEAVLRAYEQARAARTSRT
jgi:glycosyltransferase involved in cell wall biosynthesis